MHYHSGAKRQSILLITLCLAALGVLVWCYLPGLFGPFILDDAPNLGGINRFLRGELDWRAAIGENAAGLFGRPISMLSFLFNAMSFGMDAFSFKVINLLIHLASGFLVFKLLQLILCTNELHKERATLIAGLAAFAWLALAIHVSTVLYVVQRMTQLSALFSLMALAVFLSWRLAGPTSILRTTLSWTSIGLAIAAAILCKENGVLTLLLIVVIEGCLFQRTGMDARTRCMRWFMAAVIFVPIAIAGAFLLTHPLYFETAYSSRDFTLTERLLTQPRAVSAYITQVFAPNSTQLGLFHDDFPVSTGLTRPWTTLPAILSISAMIALALALRRKGPSLVACGLLFFLTGHLMESSVIPLEIYFEHRNYLPSVGLVMAVLGLLLHLARTNSANGYFKIATFAALAVVAANLAVVYVQAQIWQSTASILDHGAQMSPQSTRVAMMKIAHIATLNRFDEIDSYVAAISNRSPKHAAAAQLFRAQVRCNAGLAINKQPVDSAFMPFAQTISNDDAEAFSGLTQSVVEKKCPSITPADTARWGEAILNTSVGLPRARNIAKVEHFTAKSLAELGQIDRAIPYAKSAWEHDPAPASGILLFQLYATIGDLDQCREILQQIKTSPRLREVAAQKAVRMFEVWLMQHSESPPSVGSRPGQGSPQTTPPKQ